MNIACAQCGGEVELPEAAAVASCPFCESSLYVDLSGILLHRSLRPEQSERDARRAARFFDPASRGSLLYYPFWAWERGARAAMTPADSHLVEDLGEIPALAGKELWFDKDEQAAERSVPPDIPLSAVLSDDEREQAKPRLVHIPFWVLKKGPVEVRVDAVQCRHMTRSGLEPGAKRSLPVSAFRLFAGLFFAAGLLPGQAAPLIVAGVVAVGALLALSRGAFQGGS